MDKQRDIEMLLYGEDEEKEDQGTDFAEAVSGAVCWTQALIGPLRSSAHAQIQPPPPGSRLGGQTGRDGCTLRERGPASHPSVRSTGLCGTDMAHLKVLDCMINHNWSLICNLYCAWNSQIGGMRLKQSFNFISVTRSYRFKALRLSASVKDGLRCSLCNRCLQQHRQASEHLEFPAQNTGPGSHGNGLECARSAEAQVDRGRGVNRVLFTSRDPLVRVEVV
ncbi:hypothetical protein AAFF_G00013870 [Aldrovandia affinis]|uniref:Uncharacterized protein n=1 Tax=Aldrovandia affinis TaxID=143900 RepID=A0AAD7S6G9_9TELE|nr:hypothetical protein AAFF_G00013870 [Aldrovandia affinis]